MFQGKFMNKVERKLPKVERLYFWREYTLLLLSLLTLVLSYFYYGLEPHFAQYGSLSLFFCAVAEFSLLSKANQKHLNNSARAIEEGIICVFSRQDKYISYGAFVLGLISTLVWGFGSPIAT
jgi:membrane protein YdbS with pleckstrin-like domain